MLHVYDWIRMNQSSLEIKNIERKQLKVEAMSTMNLLGIQVEYEGD